MSVKIVDEICQILTTPLRESSCQNKYWAMILMFVSGIIWFTNCRHVGGGSLTSNEILLIYVGNQTFIASTYAGWHLVRWSAEKRHEYTGCRMLSEAMTVLTWLLGIFSFLATCCGRGSFTVILIRLVMFAGPILALMLAIVIPSGIVMLIAQAVTWTISNLSEETECSLNAVQVRKLRRIK